MEHISQNVVDHVFDASETEDDVSSADYLSATDETEQWSLFPVSSVGKSPEDSIHPDFDDCQRGRDGYQEMDLMYRIKDIYRLLDLISEQGSGGLGTICYRFLVMCVH